MELVSHQADLSRASDNVTEGKSQLVAKIRQLSYGKTQPPVPQASVCLGDGASSKAAQGEGLESKAPKWASLEHLPCWGAGPIWPLHPL